MSAWSARVNGNRLLVVLGDDARGAEESPPQQFFERFNATTPPGFDTMIVGLYESGAMRMRVFEHDGSESAFCGNGSLAIGAILQEPCVVRVPEGQVQVSFRNSLAQALIPRPTPLPLSREGEKFAFATCGEPHALYLVTDVESHEISVLGRRHVPTRNCTLVQHVGTNSVRIRTYERGVNAETGSCGSGACASIAALESVGGVLAEQITVYAPQGVLRIERRGSHFLMKAPVELRRLT